MDERLGERPRGLAVWAGLDPFGERVVRNLSRWLTDAAPESDLKEANALLPRLTLPHDGSEGGEAAQRIVDAIAELLVSPLRKRALDFADKDILVSHIWLVADADSPETVNLAAWLAEFYREMAWRQVEARVFLVLRNQSWSHDRQLQAEVALRLQKVTEQVLATGQPGAGTTLVFLVNDRDGIGGRYTAEETERVVSQALELALLGDVAHRPIAEAGLAFTPPNLPPIGGWDTVPVFASFAAETTVWEAASQYAASAERRREQLRVALDQPSPAGWDPMPPALSRIDLSGILRWRELDLPTWQPHFFDSPPGEYARMRTRIDDWFAKATNWRHEMLVTYEDYRAQVFIETDRAQQEYVGDLNVRTQGVLLHDTLPGFFSPLKRLLDRSQADLHVRRSDLRQQPPPELPDPVPTPEESPLPRVELVDADEAAALAIERKVNPWLLVQVAVLSTLIGWLWLALTWQAGTAFAPALWLIDVAATQLARIPFLPAGVQQFLINLVTSLQLPTRMRLDQVTASTWLYSGLAMALPIMAIAIITALRSRVGLERAYRRFFLSARAWRDALAGDLPAMLANLEFNRSNDNIVAAFADVSARSERLEALRAAGEVPVTSEQRSDPTVTRIVSPPQEPASPLSDLQLIQAVRAFRQTCIDDPAFTGDPRQTWACLYREAARIAGDRQPEIRDDLPAIISHANRISPRPGAVRVRQFSGASRVEVSDPSVTRFVGAPEHIVSDLSGRVPGTVLPIPVADRIIQIIVQTGISARWALSMKSVESGSSNGALGGASHEPNEADGHAHIANQEADGETEVEAARVSEPGSMPPDLKPGENGSDEADVDAPSATVEV
jgi:hypothetical protein